MKCSVDSLLLRSESMGFTDKESGAEAGAQPGTAGREAVTVHGALRRLVGGGLWLSGSQVVMVGTVLSPCGASPPLSASRLLTGPPSGGVDFRRLPGARFSCCEFEPCGVP